MIHPVIDFILGVLVGLGMMLTVTDSWWMVRPLMRRLFDR